MPSRSLRRARRAHRGPNAAAGFTPNIEEMVSSLAEAIIDQLAVTRRAAGPPWRAHHLSERESVQRTDEWDVLPEALPTEAQKRLAGMKPAELARAAVEAVRLRRSAQERGEWPAPPPLGVEVEV